VNRPVDWRFLRARERATTDGQGTTEVLRRRANDKSCRGAYRRALSRCGCPCASIGGPCCWRVACR